MKQTITPHRSITHTVTPPGYKQPATPQQQTEAFNKWCAYVAKTVRQLRA